MEVDDIYAYYNGDEAQFTFRHVNGEVKKRLDRFYCSDHITPYCSPMPVLSAALVSDHDVVSISVGEQQAKPAPTSPVYRMSRSFIHQLGKEGSRVRLEVERTTARSSGIIRENYLRSDYAAVAAEYDEYIGRIREIYVKHRVGHTRPTIGAHLDLSGPEDIHLSQHWPSGSPPRVTQPSGRKALRPSGTVLSCCPNIGNSYTISSWMRYRWVSE